jgi:hypothetical protein
MNNFKELRAAAYEIRGRLRADDATITSEELTTLRRIAQANPSAENIGLYALAKKRVNDGSKDEDKKDEDNKGVN